MNFWRKTSLNLAIIIFVMGIFWMPGSGAWFLDGELSPDNLLSSAILDATLTSANADFLPVSIKPGEKVSRLLTVGNAGNTPFAYQLKPDFGLQSNLLCSALTVTFTPANPLPSLLNPGLVDEYVVEASLPTDASLDLINNSCNFKITLLASQQEYSPEKIGFWDEEALTSTITSGDWTPDVCSDISGYKTDDSGEGLEDWQIVIHPTLSSVPVKTVTLMANDMDGVSTTTNLDENKIYLVSIEENVDENDVKLLMNGLDITGKKKLILSGEAGILTYTIKEPDETNQGGYLIKIYDVTDEIITTDKDGYYLKNVCDPDKYWIMEVPQNGWEQISPTTESYVFELPDSGSPYTFVNKKKPVKILINEVYYDVDDSHGTENKVNQSDEWVELYNPNDFPVNLKKWQITDDGEARTVSNRNTYIPAHGFAFIAKAAETFNHWPPMPQNAIRIELGQSLGNLLGNDGDRLILTDSLDNEVDFVSWGNDTFRWDPAVSDVAEGHSIQRKELGLDTDTINDWEDDSLPNPGTNPHTHFMVTATQVNNDLQIDFSNAVGFNKVKFSLSYDRLDEYSLLIPDGTAIDEATKPVTQMTLSLDPIYVGTCTTDGECVPHLGVTDGLVSLMYYYNDQQLGSSTIPFSWVDLP